MQVMIKIIACRNLLISSPDASKAKPNTEVLCKIRSDSSASNINESVSATLKTGNPVLDHSFKIDLNASGLYDNLHISVYFKSIFGKTFVGSVQFGYLDLFNSLPFDSEENAPKWIPLQNTLKPLAYIGDIQLRIGLWGGLDPNLNYLLKSMESSFRKAAIISSDDPMDDFFNSEAIASSSLLHNRSSPKTSSPVCNYY